LGVFRYERLHIQTASREDYDWTVALLTLQGLANRLSPTLCLDNRLNDWPDGDRLHMEIYRRDHGIVFKEPKSPQGLLKALRKHIKGVVLYDPILTPRDGWP